MNGQTIPLPGGPVIEFRRGFWRSSVLANGQPLRSVGRFPPRYEVVMADGSLRSARLVGVLNRALVVEGVTYPLERRLKPWEYALSAVPLLLAIPGITGGAVGFGLGFGGVFGNTQIARANRPPLFRAAAMVAFSAVIIAAYVVVLLAFVQVFRPPQAAGQPPAAVGAGDCLNGLTVSENQVSIDSLTVVSCAGPHDAEVFASIDYSSGTTYPGVDVLQSFASSRGDTAFEDYAGRPLGASESYSYLYPAADDWARGLRTLTFIYLRQPDRQLTGSIKAPATSQ